MRRKIFILNPNKSVLFGKPLKDFIKRSKLPPKLSYFMELIRRKQIIIYCDNNSSSFNLDDLSFLLSYKIKKFFLFLFRYLEIYLWLIINNYPIIGTEIIFNKRIISSNDILLSVSHNIIDKFDDYSKEILNLTCIKLFFLTHYIFFTEKISTNVKNNNNVYFIAENNLSKNSNYFKKFFNFYENEFLYLPFVAKKKFVKINNFKDRIGRCLAVGSVQKFSTAQINNEFKDAFDYYKEKTVHPLRFLISKLNSSSNNFIDSYISEILDAKRYYNRKYYDIDFVSMFNSYKMFICPEELGDLPGISFVEGMMCGSAYIGSNNNMYGDLGLKDGINYIAHNGNYNDILDKIKFYQSNIFLLEKIAERGHDIAKKIFNSDYVLSKFIKFCNNLIYKS
jgi:hypothetical protein